MNKHSFQVNLCLNVYYENNVPKEIYKILINNVDYIDVYRFIFGATCSLHQRTADGGCLVENKTHAYIV